MRSFLSIVRHAAGVLVTGTLARRSMLARGARPETIRVFANTIDVEAWQERAAELLGRRDELRESFGLRPEHVAVLCVARRAPEKGLDTLEQAVDTANGTLRLVVVSDLPHDRVIEAYGAADIFALLSLHEPWGVVVNEAAACGLPARPLGSRGRRARPPPGRAKTASSSRPATFPRRRRLCAS